ncbi:MAG: periplasmic heavy metal sensor [Alphaproteobacteria bacterium]|nr:periplasmic heavy metal sensor [Alphaproteobacteria bacterium]
MSRTRILYGVLIVSLGLNLLMGGMALGRVFHPHGGWFDHGAHWSKDRGDLPDGPAPRWMRRMFGESGKAFLDEAWKRHAAEIETLRDEMRAARTTVRTALEARPFDPTRYADALAAMRAEMDRFHTAVHALMVDALTIAPNSVRDDVTERAKAWEARRNKRD